MRSLEAPRKPFSFILRDRRGATAIFFAALLPALIGLAGLGLETGFWYALKRTNQSAADIAALSAVLEIAGGASAGSDQVKRAAWCDAVRNGFNASACPSSGSVTLPSSITVNSPYTGNELGSSCSTSSPCSTVVQVILTQSQSTFFSRLSLGPSLTITTEAIAAVKSGASCASGTGGTGTDVSIQGTASLTMPGCTITSASTSASSINLNGNANITAFTIYTSGGIQAKPSNLTLTVPPTTFGSQLTNPYASTSVPTIPTVPTLPSSVTAPTFPSLSSVSAPPNNTHFASAPSGQVSTTQPTGNNVCDSSTGTINNMNKNCYTGTNITLAGTGQNNSINFTAGSYYFTGPVTISGNATINSGVDIYVVNGPLKITGSMTFNSNSGKSNGSKAGDNIYINCAANCANAGFDASSGTVTFNGDNSYTSAYALQVANGAIIVFGNATFGGGLYSFYGGGVQLASTSGTTSAVGGGEYYIDSGNLAVGNGTANFSTGSTNKFTNVTINAGGFSTSGTATFNSGSDTTPPRYSFQVASGSNYTIGGAYTFNAGNYGFYGGNTGSTATVAVSSTSTTHLLKSGTYYVDQGSFSITGNATFDASSSSSPTKIYVKSGNFATGTSSTIAFTGTGTSTYDIETDGSGSGVTLGNTTTFGTGTYYFIHSTNNSSSGVAVNGATTFGVGSYFIQQGDLHVSANTTFSGGIVSVQSGNITIDANKTATFGSDTSCAPTGTPTPSTGSCFYTATGSITNNGTMTLPAGNYFFYAPSGSFTNAGTFTSNTGSLYVSGPSGALTNSGTMTVGSGTALFNTQSPSGNQTGGFQDTGTLTFTGGSSSNYYFFNGGSNGALNIGTGTTTTFGSGTYYLINGDFDIGSTSGNATAPTLSCVDCVLGGKGLTFVLTTCSSGQSCRDTTKIGTLQIGTVTVNGSFNGPGPSAEPTGCTPKPCASPFLQGVLIYQDPNAPTVSINGNSNNCTNNATNCNILEGGTNMNFTGAIYVPKAGVFFTGNATSTTNGCLVIIADEINFIGTSALSATGCSTAGTLTLSSTSVELSL